MTDHARERDPRLVQERGPSGFAVRRRLCAAVSDEAPRCKDAAWHAVRTTLTATKGPIRIIGNVKGRRNWAYHLARQAEAGAPDMYYYARITAFSMRWRPASSTQPN